MQIRRAHTTKHLLAVGSNADVVLGLTRKGQLQGFSFPASGIVEVGWHAEMPF